MRAWSRKGVEGVCRPSTARLSYQGAQNAIRLRFESTNGNIAQCMGGFEEIRDTVNSKSQLRERLDKEARWVCSGEGDCVLTRHNRPVYTHFITSTAGGAETQKKRYLFWKQAPLAWPAGWFVGPDIGNPPYELAAFGNWQRPEQADNWQQVHMETGLQTELPTLRVCCWSWRCTCAGVCTTTTMPTPVPTPAPASTPAPTFAPTPIWQINRALVCKSQRLVLKFLSEATLLYSGTYAQLVQGRQEKHGRPTYSMSADTASGTIYLFYDDYRGQWAVGPHVFNAPFWLAATSRAATPNAVPAGSWVNNDGVSVPVRMCCFGTDPVCGIAKTTTTGPTAAPRPTPKPVTIFWDKAADKIMPTVPTPAPTPAPKVTFAPHSECATLRIDGFKSSDGLHGVVGLYTRIGLGTFRKREQHGKPYFLERAGGAWWVGRGRDCKARRTCLMRRVSTSFNPARVSGVWTHFEHGRISRILRRVTVSCDAAVISAPTPVPTPILSMDEVMKSALCPANKWRVVLKYQDTSACVPCPGGKFRTADDKDQFLCHRSPTPVTTFAPTIVPTPSPTHSTAAPSSSPTTMPTPIHTAAATSQHTPGPSFASLPQAVTPGTVTQWSKTDHTWSVVIKGEKPGSPAAGCMGKYKRLISEANVFWLSEPQWRGKDVACGNPGGRAFLHFDAHHHMWEVVSGPLAEFPHSASGKRHLEVQLSGSSTDSSQPCDATNWVLYSGNAAPAFIAGLTVYCCTAAMREGYTKGCAPFLEQNMATGAPTPQTLPTPLPPMFPPVPTKSAADDLLQTQPVRAQTKQLDVRARARAHQRAATGANGLFSTSTMMAMTLLLIGLVVGATRVRKQGREYKTIDSRAKGTSWCLCFTVRSARRAVGHHATLDRILAGEDTSDDEEMDTIPS